MLEDTIINGMIDCDGKLVHEWDVVEMLDWCYVSNYDRKNKKYLPLYGVVKWNTEYFSYEPLIFAIDDFDGNCFAYVCNGDNNDINKTFNHPKSYFKVIGNIKTTPELLHKYEMTQLIYRHDSKLE